MDLCRRPFSRGARKRRLDGALAPSPRQVRSSSTFGWLAERLFGRVEEMHIGPLRWYAFDPAALDLVTAALAAIAASITFGLHRSLVETVVIMALLGIGAKFLIGI